MTIENRDNQRSYYSRATSAKGRTVKTYVGPLTDPVAQILCRHDQLSRATRAAVVEQAETEIQAYRRDFLPLLEDYLARVRRLYAIIPAAEGFLRRGGRWKSLRHVVIEFLYFTPASENQEMTEIDLTKLEKLAAAAQKKDEEARVQLYEALRAHPELLKKTSDLAGHLVEHMIGLIAGKDARLTEALRLSCGELRKRTEDLPHALQDLVADHLVLCWLNVCHLQAAAARPHVRTGDAAFWNEQHRKSQRRFEDALTMLAELPSLVYGSPRGQRGRKCQPSPEAVPAMQSLLSFLKPR